MSDPLRTDKSSPLDAASESDREAKIEKLLLVGLDHYFAAQYEQAINVWTRALFVDRSHARARAYVERARSALAERQRESEELLQNGVAAFHRGEGDEARRLLQAAINGGAPSDEALAVLDRLDRLERGATPQRRTETARRARAQALPHAAGRVSGSRLGLALWVALTLLIVVAGVFAATSNRDVWRSLLVLQSTPPPSAAAPSATDPGLPLPRRGETALARARALRASGRLRDALTVLDLIRSTDAQKADADQLRATIQRQLIGLTSAAGGKDDGRRP